MKLQIQLTRVESPGGRRAKRAVSPSGGLVRRVGVSELVSTPLLYAGRLRGLFSDSAACAPARRIGIEIWQMDYWTKPVILVKPPAVGGIRSRS
jgi:hypothetical protein